MYKKGQSGNPGGRPKAAITVRDMAREHTPEAIERLVFWMRSDNSEASVKAARLLIERGWGKPLNVVVGDEDGGPIVVSVEERRKAALAALDEAFGEVIDHDKPVLTLLPSPTPRKPH